ncbi:MAG: hypothetical protein PHW75_01125 [Patescibacteria group bacterium]|nr:hypothetical protein [Patescibacteria group bacterium]
MIKNNIYLQMGDVPPELRTALTDKIRVLESENRWESTFEGPTNSITPVLNMALDDGAQVTSFIECLIKKRHNPPLVDGEIREQLFELVGLHPYLYNIPRLRQWSELLGWEKVLDAEFVTAYRACKLITTEGHGDGFEYHFTVDVEGYKLGLDVITNRARLNTADMREGGRDTRKSWGYPLAQARILNDPQSLTQLKEDMAEYRYWTRLAKRLIIKAGHADYAGLPFGQTMASIEVADHPFFQDRDEWEMVWV